VNDKPTILRVDVATIVIFSVLASPFMLMALLLFWRGKQITEASFLCAAYVGVLCWIASHGVELAPGRLIHRTLFTRKDIELSRVVAASIVARPAPTLELRRAGSREIVSAFIVKPFTRAGVAAILQHIRECSPGVKLDRIAEDMSEGRFDTIARETIKAMNLLRLVLLVVAIVVVGTLVRVYLH
jgi:hypothetical protein